MTKSLALAALLAISITGCDKLKAAAGKADADGGTSASTGSGGGLLSFASKDFEGEITMSATSKGQSAPTTMVFAIKKPKVRIDAKQGLPGAAGGGGIGLGSPGGAILLVDPTQKKGWAMQPAEKRAIVFDFEKMKAMAPPGGGSPIPGIGGGAGKPKGPPPKIDKTGKKDTVAGYTCDIWDITHSDGKKSELCVAEGITWIDLTDLGWASPEVAAAAALSDMNHFPLRIVTKDAAGAQESRVEATKVEKKTIDDASMVVPPDYQVMDFSAMMGAMRGMGGHPGMPAGMPPGMPPGKARTH